MSLLPKHRFETISASASVVSAGRVYKVGVQASASAAGLVDIYNNTDGSGTSLFSVGAVTSCYASECFEETGPIPCPDGIYVGLTGSPTAFLWWE